MGLLPLMKSSYKNTAIFFSCTGNSISFQRTHKEEKGSSLQKQIRWNEEQTESNPQQKKQKSVKWIYANICKDDFRKWWT